MNSGFVCLHIHTSHDKGLNAKGAHAHTPARAGTRTHLGGLPRPPASAAHGPHDAPLLGVGAHALRALRLQQLPQAQQQGAPVRLGVLQADPGGEGAKPSRRGMHPDVGDDDDEDA